ncbi:MAG: glutamate racemase [Pseudanabaenaceae cyanobacterium]|jgi:glutamate racemase
MAGSGKSQYPIGVFDSGVGGLTVLQELRGLLPDEPMLYFGDTARVPYGNRSAGEIIEFVYEILRWMESQKAKMVVMACNTSSALALDIVRRDFEMPILGLILPGARAAVRKGRRIGVIATKATVQSEAYVHAIKESDPTAEVWQQACPEFVPLIESGRLRDPHTLAVARDYVEPLLEEGIDTLVFGCTHYPHLKHVLREFVPPTVQFVNPATYVARAVVQELDLLGLRRGECQEAQDPTSTRFVVSGDPQQFAQVSGQWLGSVPMVEQVTLSPVELLS